MTNKDYAPKHYLDPVCEVEREAYRRGFNRGAIECAVWIGGLLAFYVIVKPLAMGGF